MEGPKTVHDAAVDPAKQRPDSALRLDLLIQGLVDGGYKWYCAIHNHVGEGAPPEAKCSYWDKGLIVVNKLSRVALHPVQLPRCQVNTVVQQMDQPEVIR